MVKNARVSPSRSTYHYRVDRDIWSAERADISLVRDKQPEGQLDRLFRRTRDSEVLWSQRFKPAVEAEQLERYAETLELVARHANEGTMGCFIHTEAVAGEVDVRLYERWFDGQNLHCEELAHRVFDSDEEAATVASAEFIAELEAWAQQRNAQREGELQRMKQTATEAAVREEATAQIERERENVARDLARILREEAAREQ